jgi:hypothetical protein
VAYQLTGIACDAGLFHEEYSRNSFTTLI